MSTPLPSRRRAVRRGAALAVAAVLAGGLLAGCGGDDPSPSASDGATTTVVAAGVDSARQAKQEGATVIDVRTPEEFAAGHVEGATNIDVESADFTSAIEGLDPAATYVVYCRSGRRSALAAAQLEGNGFTVLDGGAIGDMQAAGWQVTTG